MHDAKTFDVAIATCVNLPEPDPDEAPLADALRAAGVNARWLAWDDENAPFFAAKLVIIRSTWNYCLSPEAFRAWVDRTAASSEIHNPASIVQWNLHKRYLLDLQARGIPTVPTQIFSEGTGASLIDIARGLGTKEIVIKPAVSAASARTIHDDASSERARDHFCALLKFGDTMVQPYVPSVEGYGERAIICIDGEISHAVRKSPRFEGDEQSTSDAMPIADDEAALAHKVLASFPERLLYARVDLIRDANDSPVVMELELTEPSLFLKESPQGLERFVRAIVERLESA